MTETEAKAYISKLSLKEKLRLNEMLKNSGERKENK